MLFQGWEGWGGVVWGGRGVCVGGASNPIRGPQGTCFHRDSAACRPLKISWWATFGPRARHWTCLHYGLFCLHTLFSWSPNSQVCFDSLDFGFSGTCLCWLGGAAQAFISLVQVNLRVLMHCYSDERHSSQRNMSMCEAVAALQSLWHLQQTQRWRPSQKTNKKQFFCASSKSQTVDKRQQKLIEKLLRALIG